MRCLFKSEWLTPLGAENAPARTAQIMVTRQLWKRPAVDVASGNLHPQPARHTVVHGIKMVVPVATLARLELRLRDAIAGSKHGAAP